MCAVPCRPTLQRGGRTKGPLRDGSFSPRVVFTACAAAMSTGLREKNNWPRGIKTNVSRVVRVSSPLRFFVLLASASKTLPTGRTVSRRPIPLYRIRSLSFSRSSFNDSRPTEQFSHCLFFSPLWQPLHFSANRYYYSVLIAESIVPEPFLFIVCIILLVPFHRPRLLPFSTLLAYL